MADQRRESIDSERKDEANESTHMSADDLAANSIVGNVKELVARYTHCSLCGANLHFSHVTDFSRNLTQEVSRCPECGLKAEPTLHRLQ